MSEKHDAILKVLLAKSTTTELPDGSFRVEQAGMVGVGKTREEAVSDLTEKLLVSVGMTYHNRGDDDEFSPD